MINNVYPDKQRAKALVEMAKITMERLKTTAILNFPSNTMTDYYDIIHKLLEAIGLLDGVKARGEGAHQEIIDYICKNHNLGESTRIFLQDMRDYRNRIYYEGFMVKKEYIQHNLDKINSIVSKLNNLIKDKLV